jgi:rubrerythrin
MMPAENAKAGGPDVDDIYTYPQNLAGAIQLIEEAITGETEDRLFYQYLIENAPNEEDKKIIQGIKDDEIGHFALFRGIYTELTGKAPPPPADETFTKPESYCAGLRNALQGEQNAIRKYRKILFALQDRVQINKLTAIITDETRHGILYSYLYSKNGCNV